MATEDNSTIRLFGYDVACVFRFQAEADSFITNSYTITLVANESFVLATYLSLIW